MIQTNMTPPSIDQAAIERGIARGRRARAQAFRALFRAMCQSLLGAASAGARPVGQPTAA